MVNTKWCGDRAQLLEMAEDDLIRKENLRKLGMSAKELATLGIGGYSYWQAILAEGSTKSFAEKKVRGLERALFLPRGSFDIPEGVTKYQAPAAVEAPPRDAPSEAAKSIAALFDSLPDDPILREEVRSKIAAVLLPHLKKGATDRAEGTHG